MSTATEEDAVAGAITLVVRELNSALPGGVVAQAPAEAG
jgi:hypothetical protein